MTSTSSAAATEAQPLSASRARARLAALAPALVMALYAAGAVALTMHLWADPASRMVAGNPNDNDYFAWVLRYSANAIAHGRLPSLITQAMNAPQGINLMWNNSMLLPGCLLTPVTLWLGPQVALNLLATAGFAGSAAAMLVALRQWQVSLPAASVGGAVYGFCPALVQSAIGHYNLQFAVLPPLIASLALRLALGRARPLRDGALLGVLAAAQLFIGAEPLLTTALALLVILIVLVASRPRQVTRLLRPAATGAGVAAATALVLSGWALWRQFTGPLAEHGSSFLFDFYKNDLTGFVVPSDHLLFHTSASAAAADQYQGGPAEYLAYLGVPLLIVLAVTAVAGWRRLPVRALAVTLAVIELLSLGAHPLIGGVTQQAATLPWQWLGHLPLFEAVLPDRLSIVADAAAAALAALAVDMARGAMASATSAAGRVTAIVAGEIAILAVVPLLPAPLATEPVAPLPQGWAAVFHALDLPVNARVLVVPVPTATMTQAQRWQATSGERIALNVGYFQGPAGDGHAYVEGSGVPPLGNYLNALWDGTGFEAPTPEQARDTLEGWDPAAVVAVTAGHPAVLKYLVSMLGPPSLRRGSVVAWRYPAGQYAG